MRNTTRRKRQSPIKRATKAVDGGQVTIATACGIKQSAVSMWIKRDKVPAEYVLTIERLSGVSRHDLRPDIYPVEAA